jgi:hypothetical protein
MKLIKVVNYGKNGIYLYSAIIETVNGLFWTESIRVKNKHDKKNIDFFKLKLTTPLNEYSINKYNLN